MPCKVGEKEVKAHCRKQKASAKKIDVLGTEIKKGSVAKMAKKLAKKMEKDAMKKGKLGKRKTAKASGRTKKKVKTELADKLNKALFD